MVRGDGRRGQNQKNIHALLSAALETAVRQRHLTENVAKGIRAPRSSVRTREGVVLTKADVEHIAETIDSQYATLVRIFAATGLRFSEAPARHSQGRLRPVHRACHEGVEAQ
ncbi:integrase [Arthrobacter sp. PL16]|uniref:hypothetical protein n=1 Tax=Arthrobacter sp. PL16 TaxID=3071720 RepID=UPI002DF75A28|nr:integrase [Arthrobacter sp. PL16]